MALVDFTNPAAVAWYQDHLRHLLVQGVDAFKTDFGERIPTDVVWHDGSDPRADAQLLHAPLQPRGVRGPRGRARGGRGRAVRAVRDRRRPAVPGALGRRLRVDVRLDGRVAARRAVAGVVGLRVLEPRHRRLRGNAGRRRVQAVAGVRPALVAQPPARLRLLPGAVGLRRGGRRRRPAVHPAQALAHAVPRPARRGRARARPPGDAPDGPGVPRRPRRGDRRDAVHARREPARRAGVHAPTVT